MGKLFPCSCLRLILSMGMVWLSASIVRVVCWYADSAQAGLVALSRSLKFRPDD